MIDLHSNLLIERHGVREMGQEPEKECHEVLF